MLSNMLLGFKAVGLVILNILEYAALALVLLKVVEVTWYLLALQSYRKFIMRLSERGGSNHEAGKAMRNLR